MYPGQDEYNISYANEKLASHHKIKRKNVILCKPNPIVSHYYKTFNSVPPFLFSWKYYPLMVKKCFYKQMQSGNIFIKIYKNIYL